MRSNKILGLAGVSLALLAGRSMQAQPYSNAVMSLNPPPVGYWPLQETTPPPSPGSLNLTAHNSGTLGAAGDGLYGAWYQASGPSWYLTNSVVLTNAQYTGDGSKALLCQSVYTKYVPGQYVVVPHTTNGVANDALTIKPPFSVECWAYIGSTNGVARVLVAQGATRTDCGGSDPNNPYNGGTFLGLAGFELAQYRDYLFFMPFCTNGYAKPELDTPPGYNGGVNGFGLKVGTLLHVVATYDTSGTKTIYTNGVLCATSGTGANTAGIKYVPDPVSPIMIGAGPEPAVSRVVPSESIYNPYSGVLDDVAIYTNALTVDQALAHYQAAADGTYSAAVMADSPMLYYRFDDSITPANAGYNTASFPTANNYGVEGANANGLYQPGTTPGVTGPGYVGFGANSRAVALNGAFGTVNVGNGNLPASLNPTGAVPLTVVSWFKGGPADAPNRFQEIVGHSDSSYRLALGQAAGDNHFNAGPGPEVQFANIADETTNGFALNDGKWHMVAGVSDGTNEYLYLDGRLAKTASNASGINIVGTTNDLVIGGDPQYTFASGTGENTIRNFNGNVAHVAFWTNGLSSAQIQQLYNAAGVPVSIAQQPQAISTNAGSVVALTVGTRGSAPITYQWYKNGSRVTSGGNNASLLFNPIGLGDQGSYYVAVTNGGGYAISATVTVTVAGPPNIQAQSPTDARVFTGTSPTFYVSAMGPSLTYQWSVGGSPISGATQSSYTVPNVTAGGTYTCLITNSYGPANISPITLTVLPDPAANYPQTVLSDHPMAYYRLDETSGTIANDYAGGLNGTYTNVMLNQQPGYSTNDPTVGAAQFGSLSPQDSFAGYIPGFLNFGTPNGGSSTFSVECWVNGGYGQSADVGIVALGYGNGGEQFDLDTGASANNHFFRWIVRDASGSAKVANGTTGPNDNYWHHLVGVCDQPNGTIYLYVDGVLENTAVIGKTTGIRAPTLPMSIGSRASVAGTNYDDQFVGFINDVAVYNYALSAAQVQAHYFGSGIAPVITMQPTNTTINDGATAYFYTAAKGTTPLAFQWYDGNTGLTLPNQTNAALVLSNVNQSTMDNNLYYLVVSNLFGQVQSDYAALQIIAGAPYFNADLQPLYRESYVGTPFTYSVDVGGSTPTYQWKLNGANIAGATRSSYSSTSLVGTNYYLVAVTNSAGYLLSAVGTNVGVAFPTLDALSYQHRTKITFSGYNRPTSLSDFPILVNIGTNLTGYSPSQFASPTGADLRFTDASGTRVIWHEIDEWNPNGVSTVWVQVPHLAGTNDPAVTNNYIYAYWGNSSDTTAPDYSTNGAVWVPQSFENLPQFLMVYHLKEGAFPFADSTQVDPINAGVSPTAGPGIVGTGAVFDGTSTYLDAGVVTLPQVFTLSAWVDLATTVNNIQAIWASQVGGFGKAGFAQFVNFYQTANQDYRFAAGDGTSSSSGTENGTGAGSVSFGQWHLLTASVAQTNNTALMYVDGTLLGSVATWPNFALNNDLSLGRFDDGGFKFTGSMDEARIQAGPTTPDWVWASYMTVAQNSALESYSAVGGTGATITYQMIGGKLVLTWPQGTLLSGTEVTGITNVVSGATSPYTNTVTGNSREFFRVKVR